MSDVIKENRLGALPCSIEQVAFQPFSVQVDDISSVDNIDVLKQRASDAVHTAEQKAAAIIQEAEKRSRDIIEEAQQSREKIREEAQKQGFSEGIQQGTTLAQEKFAAEFEKDAQQLRAVIEAFTQSYQEVLRNSEGALVNLALSVAEQVIKQEAAKNQEVILLTIKEGISRIQEKSKIMLRVNPEQFHFVEDNKKKLLGMLEGIDHFEVREDPHVDLGGCIIETDSGSVEARLDKQIQEIRKALTGKDKEAVDVSENT